MNIHIDKIEMLEKRKASFKRKYDKKELTLSEYLEEVAWCDEKIESELKTMVGVEVDGEVIDECTVEELHYGGEY